MQAPVDAVAVAVAVAVAIPIEVATQVAAEVEVALSAAHSSMKMPNSKKKNNNNNESISVLADWLLCHCDIDNKIPKRRTNLSKLHINRLPVAMLLSYCIVFKTS